MIKAQFASLSSDQHGHMFLMSEMRSKDEAEKDKGIINENKVTMKTSKHKNTSAEANTP